MLNCDNCEFEEGCGCANCSKDLVHCGAPNPCLECPYNRLPWPYRNEVAKKLG